jgi:hypothetical protein
MKKLLLLTLLAVVIPTAVFAQDDDWRNRRSHDSYRHRYDDNLFELTPFVGYTTGGTIHADQTSLFGEDVDLASSANVGVNFGIPLNNGLKLELMVDRQNTHLGSGGFGSDLFNPSGQRVGDFHVTYYHAGLQIPVGVSRNVRPFVIVSAGMANLDPATAGVSASNRFSASAGGGVKVPFNRNAGFRFEARGFYTALPDNSFCRLCDTGSKDLFQGQANFGVYFGF